MQLYYNIYVFILRLAGSRALRPPKNIRKRTERHWKRWEVLRKEKQINFNGCSDVEWIRDWWQLYGWSWPQLINLDTHCLYSSPPTQCLTLERHSGACKDTRCEISTAVQARRSYQSPFTFLCSLTIRRALHRIITEKERGEQSGKSGEKEEWERQN